MKNKSKKVKKSKVRMILTILLIIVAIRGYGYCKYLYLNQPVENIFRDGTEAIIIPRGASTRKIARILKQSNMILNEDVFRYKSKFGNYDGKYNYGTFDIEWTMNDYEIMKFLTTKNGSLADSVRLTIPEGYSVKDIEKKLVSKKIGYSTFLKTANEYKSDKYKFLDDLGERDYKLEGYLFPNTYEISAYENDEYVIEKMLDGFNKIWKDEYYARAKELGFSVDEIVTIASIIEKEAKVPKERAMMAAVIYNRLNKQMTLGMCSTIQYAQGEVKSKLYNKDLEIKSPYNTYKNSGLPPGPICNPGEASIKAALYPDGNQYLYFVLKNPKTGEHYFSKTYNEHLRAKRKYMK